MAACSGDGAVSADSRRVSSARSTRAWKRLRRSAKDDNAGLLVFVAQRLGGQLAVFAYQFFHALLGVLEALLAGARQLDAALEGFQRLFQRLSAGLHFFHDLFQFRESGLEVG